MKTRGIYNIITYRDNSTIVDKESIKKTLDSLGHSVKELDIRYFNSLLEGKSYNKKVLSIIDNIVVDCMVRGRTLLLNYDDNKEYPKLYDPDIDQFYGRFRLNEMMFQPQVFKTPEVFLPHVCNRKDLRLSPNFKLIIYSKLVITDSTDWQSRKEIPHDTKRSSDSNHYDLITSVIEAKFMDAFRLSNLEVILLE